MNREEAYKIYDESARNLAKISNQRTFIPNSFSTVATFDVAKNRAEADNTFLETQLNNPLKLIDNVTPVQGLNANTIDFDAPHNSVALLQQSQEQMAARKSLFNVQPPEGYRPKFPFS